MIDTLCTAFRLLTFRATREELIGLRGQHLALGLLCTWLAGMGRYWDDPGAKPLQHLGAGSLLYVVALSLFLWLFVWPLRPAHWSFRNVLTFVTLTSPPALLYALPVERWVGLKTATELNILFLAVVATWRVALYAFYLRRVTGFNAAVTTIATLLPPMGIVVALTVLNLNRVVFKLMAGLREAERTTHDGAYHLLMLLTALSAIAFVPFLVAYVYLVGAAWRGKAGGEALAEAAGAAEPAE